MRTVCLFVLLCVSALSYGAKKYKLVEISTNLGNIKIRLYENTPRHSGCASLNTMLYAKSIL